MMQISFALLSYLKIKTIYTLYIGPTPRPKHHISNPTTTTPFFLNLGGGAVQGEQTQILIRASREEVHRL